MTLVLPKSWQAGTVSFTSADMIMPQSMETVFMTNPTFLPLKISPWLPRKPKQKTGHPGNYCSSISTTSPKHLLRSEKHSPTTTFTTPTWSLRGMAPRLLCLTTTCWAKEWLSLTCGMSPIPCLLPLKTLFFLHMGHSIKRKRYWMI